MNLKNKAIALLITERYNTRSKFFHPQITILNIKNRNLGFLNTDIQAKNANKYSQQIPSMCFQS